MVLRLKIISILWYPFNIPIILSIIENVYDCKRRKRKLLYIVNYYGRSRVDWLRVLNVSSEMYYPTYIHLDLLVNNMRFFYDFHCLRYCWIECLIKHSTLLKIYIFKVSCETVEVKLFSACVLVPLLHLVM